MPTTIVMLACYNGASYLPDQLNSLREQGDELGVCLLNDDASTDGTLNVLQAYVQAEQQFKLLGLPPVRSATKAFLSLLIVALKEKAASAEPRTLFAYCDQDDIWLKQKLTAARMALDDAQANLSHEGQVQRLPALYGGRTLAVTAQNEVIGLSPLFKKAPSFRNALVQSIMGGNTMVFNAQAATLVAKAGICEVPSHDWLTYQLVSGAGGLVVYDTNPYVRYRQHEKNVVGSNLGWKARWLRLRRVWRGDFALWNAANLQVLNRMSCHLTNENQTVLRRYERACRATMPWTRLYELYKSGVYRQTFSQTVVLYVACLFGKL